MKPNETRTLAALSFGCDPEWSGLQLRIARRADGLAAGSVSNCETDRNLWLRAESEEVRIAERTPPRWIQILCGSSAYGNELLEAHPVRP